MMKPKPGHSLQARQNMFSGIVTDISEVLSHKNSAAGLALQFRRPAGWQDLELGESIATNGVCLTVDKLDASSYGATLIPETLAATSFGQNVPPKVNLERSLKVGDRISGHFVQGHIDNIGTIAAVETSQGYKLWISYPAEKTAYIVEKGSITIDGVSLTVAAIESGRFSVALVPFTLGSTTLSDLLEGDMVNLEYDVLGKYAVNVQEAGSRL